MLTPPQTQPDRIGSWGCFWGCFLGCFWGLHCGTRPKQRLQSQPAAAEGRGRRLTSPRMRRPSAKSVECLGSPAQSHPLLSIVPAQDGGTALLKTPYLRQRLHKQLRAPGVAGDNVPVERGAEAERIGGKQELTRTVKRNERARRPSRMAR